MIKNYKQLSNRYLKQNKKGTKLTIVGIVLSIALLCSMGTFMMTSKNTMENQAIEQSGKFHAMIEDLSQENYEKLKSNIKIEVISPLKQEEPVHLVKDKKVLITMGNREIFNLMNVELIEGGLPKNNDELVLEQWVIKYFDKDIKVGDKINIVSKDNSIKTYILVGIAKDKVESKYIGIANAYTLESIMPSENISALIKIKDKVDKREVLDTIKGVVGVENLRENTALLKISGETGNSDFNSGLFGVILTIVGIIIISSIMLIYNIFHISIVERTKQFGQLRAMGATKKQVKKLVMRESLILSIVAIPIGLIIGILSVYMMSFIFKILSKDFELQVEVSLLVLIGSSLLGLVTVYISAILPAKGAGKVSPLEAINTSNLISKEKNNKIKIRHKNLVKLIKIDTVMAIRNIKRNKKRFYISAISMSISTMLFITATSFIKLTDSLGHKNNIENKMQFEIATNFEGNENEKISSEFIDEVKNIVGVDEVYSNYNNIESEAILDKKTISIDNEYTNIEKVTYENIEKESSSIMLNGFDNNKLELIKPYITSGSIDNLKENEVILVKKDGSPIPSDIHINLEVGDEIKIDPNYNDSSDIIKDKYKNDEVINLKIKAIIEDLPYNLGFSMLPNIIMPTKTLEEVISKNDIQRDSFGIKSIMLKVNDENLIESIDNNLINLIEKYPQYKVLNKADLIKLDTVEDLRISILIMGFVVVIVLISSINITNTVASNITSRKREISSLKAIGMTSKGLKSMICFEGATFGIYGGIIGSILGNIVSYVMYINFAKIAEVGYNIPYITTIIAIVGVIIIGYVSALIPMRKLTNENIIEGIK